jgi:hypothetical protein
MFRIKVVEKFETRILCSITFPKIVPFIRWGNVVQRGKPKIIWRMCIACWIPEATNTYAGYVLLIAFPLQQWLHERNSMLRYTYIVCRVIVVRVDVAAIITKVFTVSKDRQKMGSLCTLGELQNIQ